MHTILLCRGRPVGKLTAHQDRDGRMLQTVAELLTTQLANVEHLTLVERLRIQDLPDARLLDVETGEVVSGRQVLCEACRAQDLFEAIPLLGTTVAR